MLIPSKDEIITLIKKDKLKEALNLLSEYVDKLNPAQGDVIINLIAKLNKLEKENLNQTDKKENLDIERNRIRESILKIVNGKINLTEDNSQGINPNNNYNKTLLLLGTFFILLVFLTTLFLPCPNDLQYTTFRTILSIGAAGVAAVIPGFFEFKYKNIIRSGGAIGVFALVYLLNPALAGSVNNCASQNYSIILIPTQKKLIYDSDFHSTLSMQIGNDIISKEIDNNGIVDFKNIPASQKNKEHRIDLNLKGWQFVKSKSKRLSITVEGSESSIEIEPDNSLSKLFGQVKDEEDNFLEDVTINIKSGKVLVQTDNKGRFDMIIPFEFQDKEQQLMVYKEGFEMWRRKVYPGLQKELLIQLKRK